MENSEVIAVDEKNQHYDTEYQKDVQATKLKQIPICKKKRRADTLTPNTVKEEKGDEVTNEQTQNSKEENVDLEKQPNVAQAIYKTVCGYMRSRNVNGRLLFAMVSGSQSYNLHLKDSDVDYAGVYLGNTIELLGIGEKPTPILCTLPEESGHTPDMLIWELKQFGVLL